jgi:predicted DCC family thiol-disulfide oxidoreductase YuxK
MIWDGDCRFCGLWVKRWRQATGDRIDYLPYQDEALPTLYPEIPRHQFEVAVHLIDTEGRVDSGAAAVFKCRALGGSWQSPWKAYQRLPALAWLSEKAYALVAGHRGLFSFLTRSLWGEHVERPEHQYVRWIFLRLVGLSYLFAFASLWTQVIGLAGTDGIMPADQFLQAWHSGSGEGGIGTVSFWRHPSLCWWSDSDACLRTLCGAGTLLAALVTAGIAPVPCFILLWIFYLSLTTVCPLFLGYQWDNLLLETGLLAIFFSPGRWWSHPRKNGPPSRTVLWLFRWLLFRLTFASGCVKLLSGDETWRKLTALQVHYETQPLPTWIGWYAHQLPAWFQKTSVVLTFGAELVLPFFIFLPRRLRMAAAWPMMGLQLLIALTGNYCFFNLLTFSLCLLLFDDAAIRAVFPRKWRKANEAEAGYGPPAKAGSAAAPPWGRGLRGGGLEMIRRGLVAILALGILTISGVQTAGLFRTRQAWPGAVIWLYERMAPWRSVNSYGLFAVMTTNRLEIIVEGSRDGKEWKAYAFKYKPGDLRRRPAFVEPFQPRLDWQMWFAALGTYRENPWMIQFCLRLLQGTPEVLALLEGNPFPKSPPKYVRAVLYEYHFTDFKERRETGAWWRRERRGFYLPPISWPGRPGKASPRSAR